MACSDVQKLQRVVARKLAWWQSLTSKQRDEELRKELERIERLKKERVS